MKKFLFACITCMIAGIAFVGCSKDNSSKFDYDLDLLYGTWRMTHIMQSNGDYFDVTTPVGEIAFEPTYATFNPDGTYSGHGEFGNGSGTYSASGKTITTYVDGEEYLKYYVLSLDGSNAELELSMTGSESTLKIKVAKQ